MICRGIDILDSESISPLALWFCDLRASTFLNSFSFSSYDPERPEMDLTARRCTFSNKSMSFEARVTTLGHSIQGGAEHTTDIVEQMCGDLCRWMVNVRRSCPSYWFPFIAAAWTCLLWVADELISAPRSFSSWTWSNSWPFIANVLRVGRISSIRPIKSELDQIRPNWIK